MCSGGVAFGINTVGRRTGEAMVVLENEEMANLALKRDKHYLDQRFIDVCVCVCLSLSLSLSPFISLSHSLSHSLSLSVCLSVCGGGGGGG